MSIARISQKQYEILARDGRIPGTSFRKKPPLTDAEKQLRDITKQHKLDTGYLKPKGQSSTGARGQYYKGQWIPSEWQLECLIELELMERAKLIKDLVSQEVLTYTIFNSAGESMTESIEMDYTFFHLELNRFCRWDAKPPKIKHTKTGRRYPQKKHADWFTRFDQLRFCQPDFCYRILEKGRTWRDIDIW